MDLSVPHALIVKIDVEQSETIKVNGELKTQRDVKRSADSIPI